MKNFEHKIKSNNSFQNNRLPFQDYKIQLFLQKIKLEEKPEYEKFLKTYFSEPSSYFIRDFKNNPVIVGKKFNPNSSFKIDFRSKSMPKKKYKKGIILQSINEQKNKSSSDHSSNEQNKQNNQKENILKVGQRYIDDLELNAIFTNFKNAQKLNKKRYINNLSINDIRKFRRENLEINKSIKGRKILGKKALKLFKGLLPNNILNNQNIPFNKTNSNQYNLTENNYTVNSRNNNNNNIIKKNSEKIIHTLVKKESNATLNDSMHINNDNINKTLFKMYQNNINNINIYKEINKTISNESLSSKNIYNINKYNDNNNKKNKNIFNRRLSNMKSEKINNNFNKFYSNLNENNKIDILKKQKQYLTTETSCKTYKKELAKKLVYQEKTLLNSLNIKNKTKRMSLYMSNKLKIPKEKLLMNKTEFFRISSEIKTKLNKQMEKTYIEDNFDWKNDLKNFNNKKSYEETIRNPNYKSHYLPNKNFYSLENKYLKKRLSKKNLIKFINNLENIKNNFDELFIEGKNLLNFELELAKSIKGKKILNNFEEVVPYSYLKDDLYANNFIFSKVK